MAALIARGHRRIGFLTLPPSLVAHGLRLEGYRRALGEAGIACDPALVVDADRDGPPEERVAIQAAIESHAGAAGAADGGLLRQRPDGGDGLRHPEGRAASRCRRTMSVAGFDDYRVISETLYPQLTTMELPYARMGEAAARLMLNDLRGGETVPEGTRILVKGDLRWRASVVPGPASRPNKQPRRKTMTILTRIGGGTARHDVPGGRCGGADRSEPLVPRRRQRGGAQHPHRDRRRLQRLAEATGRSSIEQFPQAAYNDSVTAAALSGELPDILDVDGPIMPNWAWAGYLAPLTIDPAKLDGFLPGVIGKWNDKVYSVGFWDAALAVFARKSVLDENGIRIPTLDKPWTGEEFNEILAKLKDDRQVRVSAQHRHGRQGRVVSLRLPAVPLEHRRRPRRPLDLPDRRGRAERRRRGQVGRVVPGPRQGRHGARHLRRASPTTRTASPRASTR